MSCTTNITIEQTTDPCNGKRVSTECVIQEDAIPSLFLEPNSTQEEVNSAFVLAVTSLINRVEDLESQVSDLTARILTLENQETELNYKEYVGKITQQFENEFDVTPITNTLDGDIIVERIFGGRYGVKLPGTVDLTKVVLGEYFGYSSGYYQMWIDIQGAYTNYDIIIDTANTVVDLENSANFEDYVLFNTPIEIKIYN
jgi:TolA-binding protein